VKQHVVYAAVRRRRVRNSAHLVITKEMKESASQTINTTSTINTVSDSINNNMNISNNNKATNNDNNTLEVTEQLQTMRVADNNVSICANCGKEGANNICNKCQQVKYCNAVCKKVHKKKHKKDCGEHQRLAAERAAELHDIELFKPPPPKEDCPICFLRMPYLGSGSKYKSCCGKVICSGCIYAPVYDSQGNQVDNQKCAFCRTPNPKSDEESKKRIFKRVELNDPLAMYNLGCCYRDGLNGLTQDYVKALELWQQAAELGFTGAYSHIGYAYENGIGVGVDEKKATHYYELAAIEGNIAARNKLGGSEIDAGNVGRALMHFMIAVRGGNDKSLQAIKEIYTYGLATKEDYTKALQSYQTYLGEIKSDQRDKAAAAHDCYRYY